MRKFNGSLQVARCAVQIVAPRLFFELANNPARLLGVRPSGVLIKRECVLIKREFDTEIVY